MFSVVYAYEPLVVPTCQLFALDPFLTLLDDWFGLARESGLEDDARDDGVARRYDEDGGKDDYRLGVK